MSHKNVGFAGENCKKGGETQVATSPFQNFSDFAAWFFLNFFFNFQYLLQIHNLIIIFTLTLQKV